MIRAEVARDRGTGAPGALDMTQTGPNLREAFAGIAQVQRLRIGQTGSTMLNLVLFAGAMSAIWGVVLTNVVLQAQAKTAEHANQARVNFVSAEVASGAVEAITVDVSTATWTDLSDGALGLSSITLSQGVVFRGMPLGETVRYEVARGALERTSAASKDVVMRGVKSVSFSRSGSKVTTTLEIISTSEKPQTAAF